MLPMQVGAVLRQQVPKETLEASTQGRVPVDKARRVDYILNSILTYENKPIVFEFRYHLAPCYSIALPTDLDSQLR